MTEHERELVERLAEALAGHEVDFGMTRVIRGESGPGNYILTCACGEEYRPHEERTEERTEERAHIAQALLPVVREYGDQRAREAWGEGYQAAYLFERGEVYPERENPYRTKETP